MRVVISPHNVVNYLEGAGHFWVYMQYVDGLRRIGCDVWWLEHFERSSDSAADARRVSDFRERMARYGLDERVLLYDEDRNILTASRALANDVFRSTDLLLNFHQRIGRWPLEEFRLTALVDIDPGLLQYWISSGLLEIEPHDLYFTTGQTVGTADAKFPDCGLPWTTIRPPVSLDLWPRKPAPRDGPFSTVSNWWGREWVVDRGEIVDNNKRAAFLRFADVPQSTSVPLELALFLDGTSASDRNERALLESNGWRVRHAHDVAGTPEGYQTYVRRSRGEFSCAKASCALFRNGWISDRSLCYLATGRPVVVEECGQGEFVPTGLGLLTFGTVAEAAAALEDAQARYDQHASAARELAELFDARKVAATIAGAVH